MQYISFVLVCRLPLKTSWGCIRKSLTINSCPLMDLCPDVSELRWRDSAFELTGYHLYQYWKCHLTSVAILVSSVVGVVYFTPFIWMVYSLLKYSNKTKMTGAMGILSLRVYTTFIRGLKEKVPHRCIVVGVVGRFCFPFIYLFKQEACFCFCFVACSFWFLGVMIWWLFCLFIWFCSYSMMSL